MLHSNDIICEASGPNYAYMSQYGILLDNGLWRVRRKAIGLTKDRLMVIDSRKLMCVKWKYCTFHTKMNLKNIVC